MAPVQLEDKANQVQYTGVLTEMLIMLGPAFIKFGQTLSSRADLFSDEVLQELRPLCYMVPSFSTDQVLSIPAMDPFCPVRGHPILIAPILPAALPHTHARPKVSTRRCDFFYVSHAHARTRRCT